MRRSERSEAERLEHQLHQYEAQVADLPGIEPAFHRRVLIEQLLESQRRTRYVKVLLTRELGPGTADPTDSIFDPLKAAIIAARRGQLEEAFWLLFIFVHFGRHRRAGYRYAREVYSRLGQGGLWDWAAVAKDVTGFRTWLDSNYNTLTGGGLPRGFGNHRKYESLRGSTATGTGAVVASYINWVRSVGSHIERFESATEEAGGDPSQAFDLLYNSLSTVTRFGRTARFDYLSMIGRTELADIRPGKAYIVGATGPRVGARLLFGAGNEVSSQWLEEQLQTLEEYLIVGFDVIEDALCNWQKSPAVFRPFRG